MQRNPRPRLEAVAIGGSAGSLDALSVVLPALPATLRAAIFIVLHLPREHPSLLCSIFQHRCALPVREVQDKDRVEPGTVYFAPPDYHMLVDEGPVLSLSIDEPVHFSRPSIDVLFESAADVYTQRLLGIVLSGANQDGAHGLAAIQSLGGMAVVQDPATAAMSAMPHAALEKTTPDHILHPQNIAALLIGLHREKTLL